MSIFLLYSLLSLENINLNVGTVASSTAFFIDSTHVASHTPRFLPSNITLWRSKKASWELCIWKQHRVKNSMYTFMCAHMWKLNVFFAAVAARTCKKKLFHLFSDNKKAVLHSTFYPFLYNITWLGSSSSKTRNHDETLHELDSCTGKKTRARLDWIWNWFCAAVGAQIWKNYSRELEKKRHQEHFRSKKLLTLGWNPSGVVRVWGDLDTGLEG